MNKAKTTDTAEATGGVAQDKECCSRSCGVRMMSWWFLKILNKM